VIGFDSEVTLLQDLTASELLLEDALNALQTPTPGRRFDLVSSQQFPGGRRGGRGRGGRGPGGRGGPGGRVGTALFDAVFLAADELLSEQTGRKAIVVISDGVDVGSQVELSEAVEATQRADVVLYAIHYSDPQGYGAGRGPLQIPGLGGGPNGAKSLEKLAEPTGGRLFKLSKGLALEEIFDQIEEELRAQYNLGYRPRSGGEPGFRKIELKANRSGLRVSARSGYYAGG
jgi:VWFA-related protein